MSVSTEQILPRARMAQDWAAGRGLPPVLAEIVSWLLEAFPFGPPLDSGEHESLAEVAYINQWLPDDIQRAVLLWSVAAERDETDKPAA